MPLHSDCLRRLAAELLDPTSLGQLQRVAYARPLNLKQLVDLDRRIGGPGFSTISRNGTGQYEIADREVFRPLQYCGMEFRAGIETDDLEWRARDIVEMSSLHIEALIKRIGGLAGLPLGALLSQAVVKRRLDPDTWEKARRFTSVYNDAKHNFGHTKDTHLFSVPDAVFAYVVCRKLALSLYPLARLKTSLAALADT